MKPLIVCEGPRTDVVGIAAELEASGWTIVTGWEVPGGIPPGAQIACVGDVSTTEDAARAVLAAVWGAAVVAHGCGPRDVVDQLCEDLRRIGALEHHTGPRPRPLLDDEQRALLTLLLEGRSLGDAAAQLHISRRTADRRLAAARESLGVETTTQALVEARRLRLS